MDFVRSCYNASLPCHSFTNMPKRSLRQVLNQIEVLQKEAEELRALEVRDVIVRIREAIDHYGLTPDELFPNSRKTKANATKPRREVGRSRAKSGASAAKRVAKTGVPKYADPTGSGKTWTGQGKRPGWYVAALEGGKTSEDMIIR